MADSMFYFILLFSSILCAFYVIIISSYCYAWVKMQVPTFSGETPKILVTVVIAARNEEENIETCLSSILKQNYPSGLFEIIIVDDASEDATNEKIRKFCSQHSNLSLISIDKKTGISGKKNAITEAIKIAKGELILTTDADCIMEKNWISTTVAFYARTHAKMIIGPVSFHGEKSGFEKMQSLEFMALILSGGASLYYNKAILCNGANLAYTKKTFQAVNGFEGIDKNASGDDVLLMYKISKIYPKEIHFLKHPEAMVYTKAKKGIKEFISQRKRWASKGFAALNTESKIVSLVVFGFNSMLLLLVLMGLFHLNSPGPCFQYFEIFLILFGIKCFIDILLLFLTTSFFKKRNFLIYFLPEQIGYIVYVVLTGLIGSISDYEWKGRKNKS